MDFWPFRATSTFCATDSGKYKGANYTHLAELLEEDEEVIREKDEKLIYVLIVLPDENLKDINAVKAEAINLVKDFKPRIWLSIRNNLLIDINNDELRQSLFNYNIKLRALQHYFYYKNNITVAKLLAKLLTRIWWIYHSSSPVIRLANY